MEDALETKDNPSHMLAMSVADDRLFTSNVSDGVALSSEPVGKGNRIS